MSARQPAEPAPRPGENQHPRASEPSLVPRIAAQALQVTPPHEAVRTGRPCRRIQQKSVGADCLVSMMLNHDGFAQKLSLIHILHINIRYTAYQKNTKPIGNRGVPFNRRTTFQPASSKLTDHAIHRNGPTIPNSRISVPNPLSDPIGSGGFPSTLLTY